MNKETTFENYPFWDAYKAIKAGEWTEQEFTTWAQTVWNDGAESQAQMVETCGEK